MAKLQQQEGEVKLKRVKKVKKPKPPSDLRSVYRATLRELDIERLKKPWMAEKAFKLIDTEEALQAWVDTLLQDKSRYHVYGNENCPVVAVDTETTGLDTRILIDMQENPDGSWELVYEVKVEIAGVCLSADGVEGIYIPINHERGKNVSREAAARILQRLFDHSHLVFYNAKFDREVLRLTMGINLRPYPHFEDVQSLAFINDPKADLGDEKYKYTGSSGGLKAMSKTVLGIEQIEEKEIVRVKATECPLTKKPFCTCTEEEIKALSQDGKKHSKKDTFAPFTWVPTNIALWYAAGDAICTWLLWKEMKDLARSRRLPHRIDHELVDSLIFIERQRFLIDTDRHSRTAKWHTQLLERIYNKLRALALEAGFTEPKTEEGKVLDDDRFNPDSPPQLAKLLYDIKKYRVPFLTKKGGNPSCDKNAIAELAKEHPDDEFLTALAEYKKYSALHPANLRYDPQDNSARIHLRQSTVAGGRLSASGGDYEEDGGFGMNPQGVKKVEPDKQWRVHGNVLTPDSIPTEEIEEHPETDLHESCFRNGKKAPGIIKNHIAQYTGYAICLVPTCTTCAEKHGILINNTSMDANQTVNLRCLFCAPKGWTFFSVDYCLAPSTRLLTSDLRWKKSGDVIKGEELMGFDEYLPDKKWGRRKLRPSVVERVERLNLPCIRVTTDKGSMVCYEKHGWLTKVNAGGRNKRRGQYDWRAADELKVGQEIAYLCDPWDEDTSYEAGYLRGVFDGEGWVSKQTLGFGQKSGCVLDTTAHLLRDKGFNFVKDDNSNRKRVSVLRSNGGRNEVFKFLGSIRPERLLNNVRSKMWEGLDYQSKASAPATVISVESLGTQEVVAIRTSTHTFIAEGFLSHNCNIEMRAAANISGEPKFIDEFLKGDGDFHSLTAREVFPEFSDPNVSADTKKGYRDLAKIINFALLYGGTAHAIYKNMSKKRPDITREECEKMVDTYWAKVSKFAEFVQMKQLKARTDFNCETTTGRVINFISAMETLHLRKPTDEERQNLYAYYALKREYESAKKAKNTEEYEKLKGRADRLWKDPDTGVRNAMEYNQFLGKIQRVAVNAPIQGICGDFMRIALNRLRKWVESDPFISSIFRLHTTVHDEVDFSVKNEYIPFILPRVTRLMKLRKYHTQMKWEVPIECDAEYGHSWDVDWNSTDPKKIAAWTHVEGLMSTYIPDEFDLTTVKNLLKALTSGDDARFERVKTWMKENLHPRAFGTGVGTKNEFLTFATLDKAKGKNKELKRILIAMLQLHEFWKIDHTPDSQDAQMETLEQYEARVGLTKKDRGMMPEFGYVNAIPLNAKIRRPVVEILGEEVQAELPIITVSETQITAMVPATEEKPAVVETANEHAEPPVYELVDEIQTDEGLRQQLKAALGKGDMTIQVKIGGKVLPVTNRKLDYVPQEFCKQSEVVNA